MKSIKKKLAVLLSIMILSLACMPQVYAGSAIVDSSGSQSDNHSVGQDLNQGKSTAYKDAVISEGTQPVELYASQSSMFSVSIPKTLIINGSREQENSCTYSVSVKGDIAGGEVLSIIPQSSLQLTQKNKSPITATIEQVQQYFDATTVKDINIPAISTGKVSVTSLSAGSWKGIANFDIKLSTRDNLLKDKCIVNFIAFGEVINQQIVSLGEAATAPVPPIYENYTFAGFNGDYSMIVDDTNILLSYTENL